jgi:hypothetical protein
MGAYPADFCDTSRELVHSDQDMQACMPVAGQQQCSQMLYHAPWSNVICQRQLLQCGH